ncbi:B-box zinc finger protein 22-like [Nymphaea colorata]|nr:B-box zinc finger protein 22-like [Nymphaea colorata]
MKIQCDVCESAEATVLCCADEAALCWHCDDKIHAANKLAGKHQRVPLLTPSSHTPKCDICQEKAGYFFCLEDRALLCRQCDMCIHTATAYGSSHQRFLVTGVKVGLHQPNPGLVSLPSPAAEDSSVEPLAASSASSQRKHRRGSYNHQKAPTQFSGEERVPGFPSHWPLDEVVLTTTSSSEHEHIGGFFVGFPADFIPPNSEDDRNSVRLTKGDADGGECL